MGTTHHDHDDHSHNHDDNHDHGHHGHHYSTNSANSVKQLKRVIVLTGLFMFVEMAGGIYTGSLALLSDAAHMFTDAGALGLSLFAFILSSRPTTDRRTYGFYRFEILAAFINGIFLCGLSAALIWNAVLRYQNPVAIKSVEMFWISTLGLGFNLLGAAMLMKTDHKHLNMRGALFHVLGDALGSLGAMTAALMIHFLHWDKADPIVSIIISLIIIASSFRLLLDTTHVILEGTPHHLDADKIRASIAAQKGVGEVHDLHVWSITSGMVSLSVHVVAQNQDHHSLLCELREMLKNNYQIEHVTIQIEDKSLKPNEPHY